MIMICIKHVILLQRFF